VLEVFRRLGSIQFDPLAVAGRNHDLVLHARVADYDPRWCEELLYARRELFEAYNKGLSLLPTSELPWYRVSWQLSAARHEQGILAENAEVATRILERIRAEGPLSTLAFERGPAVAWWWALFCPARLGFSREIFWLSCPPSARSRMPAHPAWSGAQQWVWK